MNTTRTNPAAPFFSPPFLVAAILLGCAAIAAGPVAQWIGLKGIKQELPLKSRLDNLDEHALWPYQVKEKAVLKPSVIEQLQTEKYLSWALVDTELPDGDPLKEAQMNVTYYTGGFNLVPHTPDVCITGQGYQPARISNDRVEVPSLGEGISPIPVRVCTFVKTEVFNENQFTVVYTFFCNGDFVATREGVRLRVNSWRNAHAFFSKVEVTFPLADREQSLEGAARLLDRVLPELVANHWPDFDEAEATARRGRRAESDDQEPAG